MKHAAILMSAQISISRWIKQPSSSSSPRLMQNKKTVHQEMKTQQFLCINSQSISAIALTMSLLLHSLSLASGTSALHPIILIPGAGGNQLEARLTTKYRSTNPICELTALTKRGNWFRLWFDPSVLLAPFTRCFAERMELTYLPTIDDFRNAPGVETRIPLFGSTQSLLYLDPHLKHFTEYMGPLVSALESAGYVDGRNLFGAPYDFRYGLAPSGHPSMVGDQYLRDLGELIESSVAANDGRSVILVAHSLGGLFALHLLDRSPLSWRRQFIKHLVTLSTPWAGTVQEMLTFASGYTLGVPLVDPLIVRGEQRSAESNLWLLPARRVFDEMPLVFANNRSYSAKEMEEFLKDIGFEKGVYPYETRIRPMVDRAVEIEGVPVTCIVGSGVDTPEKLFYGSKGFDKQPEVMFGDGDGTVNMESLLALEKDWSEAGRKNLKVVKLQGITHTSILRTRVAVNKIVEEVGLINSMDFSSQLGS
ncbi:lecithin-cholesterol acyltransferase-like 1 [Phalaenopsis equestris]|uniref:lecithin-cholesterol acyltransferase-like 1 n=1 Tax=Phalaenopsis equestris TaxID=78828 RepID=UPI0009E35912|nr:lecithin-cholesterol acyltransferase-like 1 [Phalaenopsis equestris]